tara:strand:+ start:546 stop:707 length:162 start_codon:yes stop_codon:yes gene_type:complete
MEVEVEQAYVTIHTNTAKPVGMVPLSININDYTWTMMVPEDEYQSAKEKYNVA